ncbi:hypothetical protein [Sphingomonas sp.]|uniref:hypothetical protein n=1 Tax=Sphingomonas sp. TaxID=28214 RepID=UPI003D6D9F0D
MRHQYQKQPDLSVDEWYVVADAYLQASSAPKTPLFSTVAARFKLAVGIGEAPAIDRDPRAELLRDFVARTRRYRCPANELTDALISAGLSDRQVAALALLSIH